MKKRILSLVLAALTAFVALPATVSFAADKGYVARSVSENGVAFIEAFEGYFQYAYWDYEHYTIGYGSTCTKNEYPAGISEEQAHELLKKVLPSYESGLNSFLKKNNICVTQNQYDALLSFTYNFGAYVWNREPTIAKYLKNGISKYTSKQISDAFGLWVKAGGQTLPGLVERRAAEAKYFCTADFLPNQEVYCLTNDTNVRTGAGTGYSSVGSVSRGDFVKVTAKKLIGSYTWGQITYGGSSRWISIGSAKFGAVKNTSSTLYKPCLYSAQNAASGISLSWTKVHNATGYKLYRKLASSNDYTLYKTITSNSTVSFIDKSVVTNNNYSYCIVSYNGQKTSNKSGYVSLYFVKAPILKSVERLTNCLKINWYGQSNVSGYYIMRRPSTDTHYSKIATVGSSTRSYSDTKATGGITYYYSVKCYNSKGISGYESGKSGIYITAPSIYSSYNTASTMKISFSKSYNASGYYVYRKVSGGSYSRIATIKSGSSTSYTDKTVKSGKTYIYCLRSYKGSLTSVAGSGYTAKMLPIIKPKSIQNTSSGFKLSWTKNSSASKYAVYRSQGGAYSKIATVSGSSYTDKTALSGKVNYYKVALINGTNSACYGAAISGTYYAPTVITSANSTAAALKIYFKKQSGATAYSIYRIVSGKYKLLKTVKTASFTDTTASKIGSYTYKIAVVYGSKTSEKSAAFTAYKLAAPVVRATTNGKKVSLSWNKVKISSGYILYRKAPGETKFKKFFDLTTNSFTNTTVKKNNTYYYRVKAKKGSSYSVLSPIVKVTVK